MSDENTKEKKSILAQVMAEMGEAKKKAIKADVKVLMEDRVKAAAVLKGIDDKLVAKLEGEDEATIRELLAAE